MTLTLPEKKRTRSTTAASNETKQIILTDDNFHQLKELIREYRASWRTYAPYLNAVERELERARIVASSAVPRNVVTLNSRVRLRDLRSEEQMTYTLVMPDQADIDEQRLSVLAPLGTAILGTRAGSIIRWPVPAGVRTIRVERVLHQPEADGAVKV